MSKHPGVFSELVVSNGGRRRGGRNLEEVLESTPSSSKRMTTCDVRCARRWLYPPSRALSDWRFGRDESALIVPVFAWILQRPRRQASDAHPGDDVDLGFVLAATGISSCLCRLWSFLGIPDRQVYRPRATPSWDRIKLNLPMRIGEIVRKVAIARFARTLATLTSAGVPILQALEITAKTTGNRCHRGSA